MDDGLNFCTGCGAYLDQPPQNFQNTGYQMVGRCPRCGTPHDGRNRFCVKCGLELMPPQRMDNPPDEEKMPEKRCPDCNRVFRDESLYCNMCGKKLETPDDSPESASTSLMDKAPSDIDYNDVLIITDADDIDTPTEPVIRKEPIDGNCPICGALVHSYTGICPVCGSRIEEPLQ